MAAKKARQTSTKFAREAKLRERRRAKEARKEARRQEAVDAAPGVLDEGHQAADRREHPV